LILQEELSGHRGTLLIYFLRALPARGNADGAIADLERFLIESASVRNPDLLNHQSRQRKPQWELAGIMPANRGRRGVKEAQFMEVVGIGGRGRHRLS
jgi:hypothetical protein